MPRGTLKCPYCDQHMISGIKGYPQKDQLHQHMLTRHPAIYKHQQALEALIPKAS